MICLINLLNKIFSKIISLIYPPRCISCDRIMSEDDEFICEDCLGSINFLDNENLCTRCSCPIAHSHSLCAVCAKENRFFDKNFSCAKYSGGIKDAICRFKFEKRPDHYLGLGSLLVMKFLNEKELLGVDIITAVPIHNKRMAERGFNQSELLARYLSKKVCIEFSKDTIVKIRDIPPQSTLKAISDRRKNVKNAFSLTKKGVFRGKTVLLIDDVYTTGSTADEVSRIIKKDGAKAVYVLTVANAGK